MNTVFLFVNGIRTSPGASENWTARAVTSTHVNTGHHAEKIEYYTPALGRPFHNRDRAWKLARTLEFYRDKWEIHIVGHSNGADVILDALDESEWPRVKALHLISPACEADFDQNDLNITEPIIERLTLYMASKDWALALAGTLFGKALGYGTLGRTGPKNCRRQLEVVRRPWGHNDWFSDWNFMSTMRHIWAKPL